jgi:hypothetical protein
MTDFMPESAWSDLRAHSIPDFCESTQPRPLSEPGAPKLPARAQGRPAAALAADLHELLEAMARKRVPRVQALRARLGQAHAGLEVAELAQALQALHAATSALDLLAARAASGEGGPFVRQAEALLAADASLSDRVSSFLQREAAGGPVARLLRIELVLESSSLHKRVQQGLKWLAEMQSDLVTRRNATASEITLVALETLGHRAETMLERLQDVHRLCRDARGVHSLCEQLAGERAALRSSLLAGQAAGERLAAALRPLLQAAARRPLMPAELIAAIDAHHELQVALTQAAAQVERLQASEQELMVQLDPATEPAPLRG